MAARSSRAKPKPRPGKKTVGNRTERRNRGHAVGTKLGSRAKAGVAIDGKAVARAAKLEIRALLQAADDVDPSTHDAIAREWVGLAVAQATFQALAIAGKATTEDLKELRRAEDRLARIRSKVSAPPAAPPELPLIDASDRVAFSERYLTVADGTPFSIRGREWQRDEFWLPLDGYRLWLVDAEHACADCRARHSRIVLSVYDADDSRRSGHAPGCLGLYAHIILVIGIQLRRQQGKTTGVAGYAVSSLFRYANESIRYVAGSEKQGGDLFAKNFGDPVSNCEELAPHVQVLTTGMYVPASQSEFEVRPTSLAGATGGSCTLVIVDEARDVSEKIFAAILRMLDARNGWRCPSGLLGHARTSGDLALLAHVEGSAVDPAQEQYGKTCHCGRRLEPYHGKGVAMSSAQELETDESKNWFENFCAEIEAHPEPDFHVFRSTRNLNAKVSEKAVSRMGQVLGRVAGLRDAMSVEAGGVSRRKGEPFMDDATINAILDRNLSSQEGGTRPAVGFLDTSETKELTSLNILEDECLDDEPAWHRLVHTRLDIWVPSQQVGGVIDDRLIEAHLRLVLPLFGLLAFRIDDRLRPWAKTMLKRLKVNAPFRRILKGCDAGDDKWGPSHRMLAWEKYEERAAAQTIRCINHPTLRAELKTARRNHDSLGRVDVREESRRKRHLDIADGIAACCLMVHELIIKGKRTTMSDIMRAGGRAASVVSAPRRGRSSFDTPSRYRGGRGRGFGGEDY